MSRLRRLRRWLPAVLGTVAGAPALAQTPLWYIGATQGFTHESNVFRLGRDAPTPSGISRSDTISTTSLLAGIDQPISRQRLYGNAALRASRFADNPRLNNEGYGLNLSLDWATVGQLTGNVSLGAQRSLSRFDALVGVTQTDRNIETARLLRASIALGVVTRLSAEAALNWRSVRYSAPVSAFRENDQTSVSAGLRYRPSANWSLGVGLRQTDGRYPRFARSADGSFAGDQYTRRDLYLNADWTPSGASSLDAHVNVGRTAYDMATERNYSGLTGALGWTWRPTGKLRFRAVLSRDSGLDSYFLNRAIVDGVADYSRTTTTWRLRGDYKVSAKIAAHATAVRLDRTLTNRTSTTLGTTVRSGSESGATIALGVSWTPTRNTQLGCDLSRDSRGGAPGLSLSLSATVFGCHGQILLR